jgi:homoserine kinase
MSRASVTVRIPASTSNLGSGFDTLGLALRLYNVVCVARRGDQRLKLAAGTDGNSAALTAILTQAARLFFRRTAVKRFGMEIGMSGDVPVARGLGASAIARVGLLAGLNALAGTRLTRVHLLQLATQLEGHPDNASPAIFGGFTVSGRVGGEVRCLSFPVSTRLKCVTLIPRFGMSTGKARRLLPSSYTKADTAHALNRAALISAAMASGRYEALRGLFDDRIHQPYRGRLIPQFARVVRAGERAGALGGFLSGAGSGIICLTLTGPAGVTSAMNRAWGDADVKVLTPDNDGFQLIPVKET